MSKIIILGSSGAVPTEESENTHFVIVGSQRVVLVDSPNNTTILRLKRAGLDFRSLTDLIVTHFHPDHTLGIPALLMNMWILGRKAPLNIHGLPHVLNRLNSLLDLYDWAEWIELFPVTFHPLSAEVLRPLLDCPDFEIRSSPVRHSVPNIGIRVDFKPSHKSFAYSCDTRPCDEVIQLAAGADVLLHEAAGDFAGHSSANQAGEIARKAGVEKLILIHYPTQHSTLIDEAQSAFGREVALAKDFMVLDFLQPPDSMG